MKFLRLISCLIVLCFFTPITFAQDVSLPQSWDDKNIFYVLKVLQLSTPADATLLNQELTISQLRTFWQQAGVQNAAVDFSCLTAPFEVCAVVLKTQDKNFQCDSFGVVKSDDQERHLQMKNCSIKMLVDGKNFSGKLARSSVKIQSFESTYVLIPFANTSKTGTHHVMLMEINPVYKKLDMASIIKNKAKHQVDFAYRKDD